MSAKAPIRVGILGFGVVGEGAYRMMQDNRAELEKKVGIPFEVVRIAVRDLAKARSAPSHLLTDDPFSVVNDPQVDVVLELIGGLDPAAKLVETALLNDKHVVTANKELIAKHGSRLVSLARDRKLDLHYEAAVGGGIPLIQPMKHQLAGNEVLKMMGILNGTTNYILTKMFNEGAEFSTALAEAQACGYAEADPTNDVDGFDAVYKISILASIAFGQQAPFDQVHREGIRAVSKADMFYAALLGFRIKLLGIVEPVENGRILARVHPTMIPKDHPLASVNDVYNALWLNGDFVGDVMFSGRGAGANPTASAVIGDLIDVGRNIKIQGPASAIPYGPYMEMASMDDLITRYYIRVLATDRPKGLGHIAMTFGDNDVSLAAMELRPKSDSNAEVVFLTHPAREVAVQRTLSQLKEQGNVQEIASCIRVEA